MNIHFSFQNFDEQQGKPRLEEYVNEKKLKSLVRLLKKSDLDLADLEIRAEYLTHHNSFLIKLNLKIAKRVLFAQEVKHSLTQTFDLALGKLVTQLRKVESVRHKNKKKVKIL